MISICIEGDFEVMANIQEEFAGITSLIVEGDLFPVSYNGYTDRKVLN